LDVVDSVDPLQDKSGRILKLEFRSNEAPGWTAGGPNGGKVGGRRHESLRLAGFSGRTTMSANSIGRLSVIAMRRTRAEAGAHDLRTGELIGTIWLSILTVHLHAAIWQQSR